MKRRLTTATLWLAGLIGLAWITAPESTGQPSGQQIQYRALAPSGACAQNNIALVTPNGTVYTCQSGTWGQVGGAGAGLGANTFTGQQIINASGAASTPPLLVNGAWFSGGSAATTQPQLLIQPPGATAGAWNTNGTGLGVNCAGFNTSLGLDIQAGGFSLFKVSCLGAITAALGSFSGVNVTASATASGSNVTATNVVTAGTDLKARDILITGSAPTLSGCSTSGQLGGNTAGSFISGTTGTCAVTMTFATSAPNEWFCDALDSTTPALFNQTGGGGNTAIISGATVSGDKVRFSCTGY